MANLQTTEITGFLNLCQVPAAPTTECRLWYDSTDCRLKYIFSANAWALSPAALNCSRFGGGGAGDAGSALYFTGRPGCNLPTGCACYVTCTEEYNGSTWSTGGAFPVTLPAGGGSTAGSQNAALAAGGDCGLFPSQARNQTYEYNGSTWGSGGNLNTARFGNKGDGTQNAAFTIGSVAGNGPDFTFVRSVEKYNGSSWSNAGGLTCWRRSFGASGTQNAALLSGGVEEPNFGLPLCDSLEYNGSSFSTGGNMTCRREDHAAGGSQNAAWAAGGTAFGSGFRCVEYYNGTTWSVGANLPPNANVFGASGKGPTHTQSCGIMINGGENFDTTRPAATLTPVTSACCL
jgi:hypothetical protein